MPTSRVRENFNQRKIAVLRLLANNGPLTPPEIAARLRIYPVRAVYSYMQHLAKWQLVTRGRRWRRGRMLYQLTQKGSDRLAWLEGRQGEPVRR